MVKKENFRLKKQEMPLICGREDLIDKRMTKILMDKGWNQTMVLPCRDYRLNKYSLILQTEWNDIWLKRNYVHV